MYYIGVKCVGMREWMYGCMGIGYVCRSENGCMGVWEWVKCV